MTQRINLQTHIKSNHEVAKYTYFQCDYQASQRHNLQTHIKAVHMGGKYYCDKHDNPSQSMIKNCTKLSGSNQPVEVKNIMSMKIYISTVKSGTPWISQMILNKQAKYFSNRCTIEKFQILH